MKAFKIVSEILVIAVVAWFVFDYVAYQSVELEASREPLQGFEWKEIHGHGMRLLAQESDQISLVPVEDGFALKEGENINLSREILVIDKPWWKSATTIIEEQFISALPNEAREGCGVVELADGTVAERFGVHKYTIVPVTEKYKEFVEKNNYLFPNFDKCGAYGTSSDGGYFEYHVGNPGRLFFLRPGHREPVFEPRSLIVE